MIESIMNDDEAILLVKNTFEKIHNATNNYELEIIPTELEFQFKYDEKKYTPLTIHFSHEDIEYLNHNLPRPENIAFDIQPLLNDPISKLLYALAWKQGDIPKSGSILAGINNADIPRFNQGAIFRQFGRHLANKNEPIVDQHVLRAFEIFRTLDDLDEVIALRKREQFHVKVIKSYTGWFKKTKWAKQGSGNILDHVLFGLGKTIKTSSKKRMLMP